MKIGSPDVSSLASTLNADRKAQTADKKAGASEASENGTKVALSATASMLTSASGEGSFDAAKVERIAAAIRNGEFKINPEKIADKLISNADELLQRRR
jgi:negative regulator of flagellin synthesis FlgM